MDRISSREIRGDSDIFLCVISQIEIPIHIVINISSELKRKKYNQKCVYKVSQVNFILFSEIFIRFE